MIEQLFSYYSRFIKPYKGAELPGEHHFVALYLVPKIFSLTGLLPEYINPDGMKKRPGDIIYEYQMKKKLSIEVKYMKINFTKTQCNNWIFDGCNKPDYLIAVGLKFLLIQEWRIFVDCYKEIMFKNKHKEICKLKKGYSPSISVDEYCEWFIGTEFVFQNASSCDEIALEMCIKNLVDKYKK